MHHGRTPQASDTATPEPPHPLPYYARDPESVGDLPPLQRLRRVLVVVGGLAAGAWMANWSGHVWGDGMDYALTVSLVFAAFALIPAVGRRIIAVVDRARHPTRRTRALVALSLAVGVALVSYVQAIRVSRELTPHWHDEHSYLLQAVHLSQFRLWVTPPPEWPGDFFESFHIFTDPVYCSVYWPGTALMNVPGVWLGLPSFVMPLVIYGLTVAMIYLLTTRIMDGVAGLMAAILATFVLEYHSFSTRIMAQVPTALLGGCLIWAWLNWREARPSRRLRWVAAMGVFAGWLGITRPVDGLAFAVPVAMAVIWTVISGSIGDAGAARPRAARAIGRLALTAAAGIGCALPFLALQIAFNKGVTGRLIQVPYVWYFDRYQPGFTYASVGASRIIERGEPQTDLKQKFDYYEYFIARGGETALTNSIWRELSGWRIPTLLNYSFPGRNFFGFGLVGIAVGLGLYGRIPGRAPRPRRPVCLMAAVVAAFLAFYAYNPLFLTHYSIMLAVVTLPLAAVGLRAAEECAGARLRPFMVVLVSGGMVAWMLYTVIDYAQVYSPKRTEVTFAREEVPEMLTGKAIVLSRYARGANIHNETVYNSDVAFPDDARIIWAHELGPRTVELLRYYEKRDPERFVYVMVRPWLELYPMGTVPECVEMFENGTWPLPPPEELEDVLDERGFVARPELRRHLPKPLKPLKRVEEFTKFDELPDDVEE